MRGFGLFLRSRGQRPEFEKIISEKGLFLILSGYNYGMTSSPELPALYLVLSGPKMVARGPLATVLPVLRQQSAEQGPAAVLVFREESGRQIDFDLRKEDAALIAAEAQPLSASSGPGRPRLGVVAREVTLFPRHWEWLEAQPNGASAALRRLVDQARKAEPAAEKARRVRDALYRVLNAVGGDLPGFEEVIRALYARESGHLDALVQAWPPDLCAYAQERYREAERLEKSGETQEGV